VDATRERAYMVSAVPGAFTRPSHDRYWAKVSAQMKGLQLSPLPAFEETKP
jgi:hypothetical protein